MNERKLCDMAIEAMKYSYSPYSEFTVGAALLGKSGKVYTGCNIENASFSPTVCAERTAFFKAISQGETAFEMIAVAGGKNGEIKEGSVPCGVCRQVMNEFCSDDFVVLVVSDGAYRRFTLAELLPCSFGKNEVSAEV